ncbi:hypothetical protein AB0L40_06875 [Patulibacter sp. NPDC049589]|uniref:RCC1 domain-containing protein n=1 Tax=Patulibacter sp. NPDC049589 TaxID=3154731 RepID=UPI00343DD3CD
MLGLAGLPALANAGTLRGLGHPYATGIGTVDSTPRGIAVLPNAPADATAAAAGDGISLVLTPGGVYSTGYNLTTPTALAGLGLGATATSPGASTLQAVPGTADVKAVAAGGQRGSLLLHDDGTVSAFGANIFGNAGGTVGTAIATPTTVAGLTGITQVAAGPNHSLALDGDGNVWAWGQVGQLGTGGTAPNSVPAKVLLPAGRKAVQVAAGVDHSLALLDDGTVVGWGVNTTGALGDGTTTTPPTASPVVTVTGLADAVGPKRVVQIAAGDRSSFALLADGSYRAWGYNSSGRLGLGLGSAGLDAKVTTATTRAATTDGIAATSYPAFKQIVSERAVTYALTTDGRVFGWGQNSNGELGGPTLKWLSGAPFGTPVSDAQVYTEVPQPILGLTDVPWLATGGAGRQQIVVSEPILRQHDSSSPVFTGQEVGTISPVQNAAVAYSNQVASSITKVYLEGDNARDFLLPRGAASGDADIFVTNSDRITAWPFTLPVGSQLYVPLRFAPGGEGLRTAFVVVETANGETLRIAVSGIGTPATGGPKGDTGTSGATGAKGDKGDTVTVTVPSGGTISVASTRTLTTVKRGKTAKLPFVLLNGTAGTLPKSVATAGLPTALRATGTARTAIPALASGTERAFSVPVRVGKRAALGTRRITVTIKVAGKTVRRTASLRVSR